VRVTDLDDSCWHCQFARFRWPTKDGNERGRGGIEQRGTARQRGMTDAEDNGV